MLNTRLKLAEHCSKFPFIIFYQGNYENMPAFALLKIIEKNLSLFFKKASFKPLLYVVIEALQNVERYSTHKGQSGDSSLIYMDEHNFYIYSQNLIENEKVNELKNRLDSLVNKSREELDQKFNEVLASEIATEKGAGLGLIDIARKTHNRLFYEFKKIDDSISSYCLGFALPLERNNLEHFPNFEETFAVVNKLNTCFGNNQSTLYYGGDFSNNFVHALLNFLKTVKKETEGGTNKVLHHILIELTQNVKKHGVRHNEITKGQLTLEWNKEGLSVTTYNEVLETHAQKLQEKTNKLNASDKKALTAYSKEVLTDFSTDSGVGLIDVAALVHPEKIFCHTIKKPNFTNDLILSIKIKNE